MNNLKSKIAEDFKEAFRKKELLRKSVLEQVLSEIRNQEIEKKKREEGLSDSEVLEVINRAVKQRRDSMEQYKKGGREDLFEKEKKEEEILLGYLPKQLSQEEVQKEIKAIIVETGAQNKKDFGKVMGMAMKKLKGKADGEMVRQIVESMLSD